MISIKSRISGWISSYSLILILIFAVSRESYSQEYTYEVHTIPLKGELHNFTGTCIMQDSDGFMWFGSDQGGLYRYSGTGFRVFKLDPYDSSTISSNTIFSLFEDSEGYIWVGTMWGLSKYDKYADRFTRYMPKLGDSTTVEAGYIAGIIEDQKGDIWLTSPGGFSRFEKDTEKFTHYRVQADDTTLTENDLQVTGLYFCSREFIWVRTQVGAFRFDPGSGSFLKLLPGKKRFTFDMYEDRSGRFWIGRKWIRQYHFDEGYDHNVLLSRKNPNHLRGPFVLRILEDKYGYLWIKTSGGIHCYTPDLNLEYYLDRKWDVVTDYNHQDFSFCIDNTGAVWYLNEEGIHRIIRKKINFLTYDLYKSFGDMITGVAVKSKDSLVVMGEKGIYSLDLVNKRYDLYYGYPGDERNIIDQFSGMLLDRNGFLWSHTYGGLQSFQLDPVPPVISRYSTDIGVDIIRTLFEDRKGRIWIGEQRAPLPRYFDPVQKEFIRLVNNPHAADSLPPFVHISYEEPEGTLWAIGWNGIYKVKLPLTMLDDHTAMPADVMQCKPEIGDPTYDFWGIKSTLMARDGTLWIGVSDRGVRQIKEEIMPGTKNPIYRIRTYTEKDGLVNNTVWSLIEDSSGNIWMGSLNGLSRFDRHTETFTNFFKDHGLPSNRFQSGAVAIGEDNELFFGNFNGLVAFYPDSIQPDRHVGAVKLTGLKINNREIHPGDGSVLEKSLLYTDNIELSYKQDNLSFEYAILNFQDPEMNQFRYRMEGLDEDWIYAGNRTRVDYTNLRPGTYTFHVTGSNSEGVWNEEGTSLQVFIHPPPWLTWYAYLFYGIILIGTLAWYRRLEKNRAELKLAAEVEKIEKEKVLEMDRMKSRFFANISHEFRTPLTLVMDPLGRLDQQKSGDITFKRDLVSAMRRNARKLLNLINQLLDLSKLETGEMKLHVSEGDLEAFIRMIANSFLSLAESKKIFLSLKLPGTSGSYYYDPDKLEKILSNLLSNAFKYTSGGGEVSLKLNFIEKTDTDGVEFEGQGTGTYAEIIIRDTGEGIPAGKLDRIFDRFYQVNDTDAGDEMGTGIGLSLTRELVELYRGNISVESKEGSGSTFTVTIPASGLLFKEEEIMKPDVSGDKRTEQVIADTEDLSGGYEEYTVTENQSVDSPMILVVEDNADLRNYISYNLGKLYRIISAENGREGLALAIDNIPDLVLSDLMMPEMDGMELCRKIKQDERTNHIPVVLLTAKAGRDSKIEGYETGADDYLMKPFDTEELQVRVKNLIDQRNKLKEKFRLDIISQTSGKEEQVNQDSVLDHALAVMQQNIDNPEFTAENLAAGLNMSRAQVFRKINAVAGITPIELLRTLRLKKAAFLLETGNENVIQVMLKVGYSSPSHFTRAFREFHGENPSEYKGSKNR